MVEVSEPAGRQRSLPRYGVIVPAARADVAVEVGADYIEPTIVDNVILEAGDGRWRLNPHFAGTRWPSFAILVPGHIRLSDPRFPREQRVDYFAQVLALLGSVAEPGAKVVVGSGAARTIPEGADRADASATFADTLRLIRDLGAAAGLMPMLEPLHRGETNLINSIGEAAAFLEEHGIEKMPLVADLFHIHGESEPFSALHRHATRIGHAHIADAERRYLTSGDWPWAEFVRELRAVGYRGDISLECRWGDDFAAELRTSLAALRALEQRPLA